MVGIFRLRFISIHISLQIMQEGKLQSYVYFISLDIQLTTIFPGLHFMTFNTYISIGMEIPDFPSETCKEII